MESILFHEEYGVYNNSNSSVVDNMKVKSQ